MPESFSGESGTPYQMEPTAVHRNHVFFPTAIVLDMCLLGGGGGGV